MLKNKVSQQNVDKLSAENKNIKAKLNEMKYKTKERHKLN